MTGLPYDPDARRDTPLARKLKERIRREGPISVAEYIQACLQDPVHGYYRTKAAIGRTGDFVTAPEISQVFGELVGLWCAVVWQQMGSPSKLNLVELGPGRGTMMRDMLRATRLVPGFLDAVSVHLVESSESLARRQTEALAQVDRVVRHRSGFLDAMVAIGRHPAIVIGNEFLDALPIHQFVASESNGRLTWRMRTVALDATGRLQFSERSEAGPLSEYMLNRMPDARHGEIAEFAYSYREALLPLTGFALAAKTAALLIDYGGTEHHAGDTLQAVRAHRFEHPLTSPGEADLTAQVRFGQVSEDLAPRGPEGMLAVDGPVTQAEFLGRLGIMERASRLMAQNPAKAAEIETGVARLMAVPGMGSGFKAIGVRSAELPPLPGF